MYPTQEELEAMIVASLANNDCPIQISELSDFASRIIDWHEKKLAEQEPVATKLETQQFNCFHVGFADYKRLEALPVGAKLYTRPMPLPQPPEEEQQ